MRPPVRPSRESVMEALLATFIDAVQTQFTAGTKAGSTTLANPSVTKGLFRGLPVFGNGILEGSIITGLSPLTISQPATVNALAAALTTGFVTAERRAQFTRDIPTPALLIRCLKQRNAWIDGLPVLSLLPEVCVISNSGTNPDVVPETALNNFMDALDSALKPDSDDGVRFTLGGLVYWCRMNGDVDASPGDLGPQGIAYSDMEIILP